jgi:dTDP-4-amino-4,6-dideoxygalactose transaminase
VDRLAVFGGPASFSDALHVGTPVIANRSRLLERIDDAVRRGCLADDGPYVRELERRLSHQLEVPHCVAVSSGTTALQLVARALELSGEVILPSFTSPATAHALAWLGLTPVFCDIDPHTYMIDPALVDKLVTPRTSAIVGVHLFGQVAEVAGLTEVASARRLKLIFDAAHAFGCATGGTRVGGFGDAEVFSFHAAEAFHAGEGGAVTTSQDWLADRIMLSRNFGLSGVDRIVDLGINGKMSELAAAVGLSALEEFDGVVTANRERHARYQRGLRALPGVEVLRAAGGDTSNYQYVVLEIDAQTAGLSRDELWRILHQENVLARRYGSPGCHLMLPYRGRESITGLPVTEDAASRLLCLPTGPAVSLTAVDTICEILRLVFWRRDEVRRRLDQDGTKPVRVRLAASPSWNVPAG